MNIEDFTSGTKNPTFRPESFSGLGSASSMFGNRPNAGSSTYNVNNNTTPPLAAQPAQNAGPVPNSVDGNEGTGGGNGTNSNARITFYHVGEDPYGDTTSQPGPDGRNKAIEGQTVSVDPSQIPYGSGVHIPALKDVLGHDAFYAHDTGSDVVSRKASSGKLPILDVFLKGAPAEAEARIKAISAQLEQRYPGWEQKGLPYSVLGKVTSQYSNGQKAFDAPSPHIGSGPTIRAAAGNNSLVGPSGA
jgi:3D (Asp-Asp-Asp) domain-containing protein